MPITERWPYVEIARKTLQYHTWLGKMLQALELYNKVRLTTLAYRGMVAVFHRGNVSFLLFIGLPCFSSVFSSGTIILLVVYVYISILTITSMSVCFVRVFGAHFFASNVKLIQKILKLFNCYCSSDVWCKLLEDHVKEVVAFITNLHEMIIVMPWVAVTCSRTLEVVDHGEKGESPTQSNQYRLARGNHFLIKLSLRYGLRKHSCKQSRNTRPVRGGHVVHLVQTVRTQLRTRTKGRQRRWETCILLPFVGS